MKAMDAESLDGGADIILQEFTKGNQGRTRVRPLTLREHFVPPIKAQPKEANAIVWDMK